MVGLTEFQTPIFKGGFHKLVLNNQNFLFFEKIIFFFFGFFCVSFLIIIINDELSKLINDGKKLII